MKPFKMACVSIAFILVIFLLAASAQSDGNQKGKSDDVKGDVTKGQKTFEGNCSICHEVSDRDKVGPGLKGISKKGPDKLSDGTEHKDHSAAVLEKQVVEGGGAMPAVGVSFSDKEVHDLIAYLMTL
jgi:mono/diheme cytochrome c family protein